MKTSTSKEKHGIQWTSRMQLDDLDFADDLALLSQTQQQMQEKTTSVAAASAAVGLNIHNGKSKILRYNTACTNPITIDGEDLEDFKTFTYLGSIVDEQGGSVSDVKARINKAKTAYLQLKNIWNSKQLSTNTKGKLTRSKTLSSGTEQISNSENTTNTTFATAEITTKSYNLRTNNNSVPQSVSVISSLSTSSSSFNPNDSNGNDYDEDNIEINENDSMHFDQLLNDDILLHSNRIDNKK
ncbi:unnamed protein product [Schistosoma margrebowiei]|uniref:Uncharacterized protein n=1 Tax=Schistosoma margrebowiei TaxID=48269 RepID=A0A183LLX3_9TREM|nr:unnamed protein product [Schistosoma margrebowiei]